MQDFTVIIPARQASSRLPNKPLLDIVGKPMVIRVVEQALKTKAKQVIVATDSMEIVDVVKSYGYDVCLTSDKHNSGTERLAEVIALRNIKDDEIIVNVQGDEPLIPPSIIQQVADNLATNVNVKMATLGVKLTSVAEIFNPNIVKVVKDKNNLALYFSRAPIPYARDNFTQTNMNQMLNYDIIDELKYDIYLRHIGLYSYRAEFIKEYIEMQACPLEQLEKLEQLRVLWHGEKIHIDLAQEIPPIGVDTKEDLENVIKIIANKGN